jgi:iron complex transport system substrate-binding protein
LALKPDLVVVSGGVTPAVTRLHDAGITVFMLGDLTGWTQCAKIIVDFGRLLCVEERAARLLARHEARLAAVAAQALAVRPRALWVAVIGDRLYGGTIGTSYHDLLIRAGCSDVAAGRYTAWPEYSFEDVLMLNPEIIVTATGQGDVLRRRSGADRLHGRIIELPEAVAGDPGLGLVDAVEQLHAALRKGN